MPVGMPSVPRPIPPPPPPPLRLPKSVQTASATLSNPSLRAASCTRRAVEDRGPDPHSSWSACTWGEGEKVWMC